MIIGIYFYSENVEKHKKDKIVTSSFSIFVISVFQKNSEFLKFSFQLLKFSLSLFYRYYFGRCSSELAQLVPLLYSRERSTCYSDRLHDFSVIIRRCYKDVYVNSFFPCTARLWNSLPIECFPLTYDLNSFKSRINRHLLTACSF